MSDENKKDLRDIVKSRIKGLGLDALFHQVDLTKKDEPSSQPPKWADSPEERNLLEKLKNNFFDLEPEEFRQKFQSLLDPSVTPQPQTIFALSLGPGAIKILEIKNSKGQAVVQQARYLPIPFIVTSTPERLDKFIVETLRQNLNREALKDAHLALVIPRSKAILKFLSFPTCEQSEIEKMISFEAEHHLPFPLRDVETDHHVLEKDEHKSQILLAAIRREDVAKYLHLLAKAELRPDSIAVSSLALYNSLLTNSPHAGVTLQIHVGSTFSDLNIVKDGKLKSSRGVQWGSKNLTQRLSNELNVSLENAEKIKKENGIVLTKAAVNDIERRVSECACLWADYLIMEIQRTMQYFQLEKGITPIDRILLTGGGAQLLNLNEYLRDRLQIITTSPRPPKELTVPNSADAFQKYFQEFHNLLGAGLQGLSPDAIAINLLPQNLKHERRAARKRTRAIVLGSLAGVALFLVFLLPASLLGLRENIIRGLDKKIKGLETQVAVVQELQEKVRTIEDYISTRQSCMEALKEITLRVTPDILVKSFAFEKNETISLVGEADSHASVVNFSRSLTESQFFKNVTIRYTSKKDRLKENVNFEIVCALN
jgi:type IV pilus assembly protein PilM